MKKIIVIGGGISGMVAGIYGRLAGFEVELFEAQPRIGGLCTGWKRQGYNIDGCIHWLTGSRPGTDLHNIWLTCGALDDNVKVVDHDIVISCFDGNEYRHLYADPDRLENEWLALWPDDAAAIRELAAMIRCFGQLPIPARKPQEMTGFIEKIKFALPYIKAGKYMKTAFNLSIADYLSRFRSPVIRRLLGAIVSYHDIVAYSLLYSLASYSARDAGWPMGGSAAMAERMLKRFIDLGGTAHLKTPVTRIVVEGGKAIGIATAEGEHHADYIISAISEDVLLKRLLEGRFHDTYFEERCAAPNRYPLLTATMISFGVNTTLNNRPEVLSIENKQALRINRQEITNFAVRQLNFDPLFSDSDKTLLEVIVGDSEYDWWRQLKAASDADYRRAKADLAAHIQAEIEAVYPEIVGHVEMCDVATPLTFERYCASYRGAYMSFSQTPGVKPAFHKGCIEGLKNLYLAGQWACPPGGLPMVAVAGKFAVQRICRKEKIKCTIV